MNSILILLFFPLVWLGFGAIIWPIKTRNKFVKYDMLVKSAASSVDVYFKKRYDLIPKLVDAASNYMEYEMNALKTLTKIRAEAESKPLPEQDNIVQQAIGGFMAVAEQYPQLKADTQFKAVTDALNGVEDELSAARRSYNSAATMFNTQISLFPDKLLAFGYSQYELFRATEIERQTVDLNFRVPM